MLTQLDAASERPIIIVKTSKNVPKNASVFTVSPR